MAYLKPEEEEQQAGQPMAPGAIKPQGGLVPGGPGGVQPQQTPQQKQGTGGFTNLQRFLDAGAGRDQNISKVGGDLLKTETSTFDAAKEPLESATFTPTTFTDEQIGGILGSGGVNKPSKSSDPIMGAPAPAGGFDALKGALTQDYTGPMSVDYDPTKGTSKDNLLGLDALAGTNTTGAELAKRLSGGASYGAGSRRFDNAMFGADVASQKAIGTNKEQGGKFLKGVGEKSKELANKAKGFKDAAAQARNATRGQLEGFADRIVGGVDSRVKTASDAEQWRRMGAPQTSAPAGYMWDVYEGGGTPTRQNMVTADESGALQKLGKLIGMENVPQIHKGGEFTPGEWKYAQDLSQVDTLQPVLPKYEYRPVGPDPGAQQGIGLGSLLGGIFSGGLSLIPMGAIAANDPNSTARHATGRNAWFDENGNEVEAYREDPSTGEVVDVQTGQRWPKEWIDSGKIAINPATGKYEPTGR
jgi:hypothetical protein